MEQSRVCRQPSKLVMRVRFPSPAHRRPLTVARSAQGNEVQDRGGTIASRVARGPTAAGDALPALGQGTDFGGA